jgi:hypothetical protein
VTRLWPSGQPIQTWGERTTPAGFVWRNRPHTIVEVSNRWRIHTRWWEPGAVLWREYLKVATDSGLLCLLYRDLPDGGWSLARLYD